MAKRETGITGYATVVLGGGVGAAAGRLDDGSVTLALCELKEPIQPGEPVPDGADKYDFQVFMNFDNMESLTAVRKWLDGVENLLKGREEE